MKLNYKVLAGDFSRAGEASSSTKKTLKKLGIDSNIIRKIAICMYEAEINMVIHANGGEVNVDIQPDNVSVVLEDTGPGIPDIDMAMTEGFSTATEEVRDLGFGAGMGLPNMKKHSDCFKLESVLGVGTKVFIQVQIPLEYE